MREPLTSDVIFKAVFGKDNKESKKALIGLLHLILNRKDDPIVSADEKMQALKISREKYLMDEAFRRMRAKEEGKREGIVEGSANEKNKIAKNLLAMKMPKDQILMRILSLFQ